MLSQRLVLSVLLYLATNVGAGYIHYRAAWKNNDTGTSGEARSNDFFDESNISRLVLNMEYWTNNRYAAIRVKPDTVKVYRCSSVRSKEDAESAITAMQRVIADKF
ncbi:hypothetical protein K461DRAFT_68860 [Myriangium duriaei CBS 260.36]|uniref:DUF1508 domain-containing protein n=1 Tax=Myriangium duriaei CBS 260.36 TaxID=1168546 RepID=A0A9P4IUJ8_9PEZI|nr:hypothetical protein K461DRAFT_68860 [Myriangium duriaei CBS 260.36]